MHGFTGERAVAEIMLGASGVTRRFGGLTAVDRVSIDLERDAIHALIGPNGAGKSTLINLLSGELDPSEGSISFRGEPVPTGRPERMAHARHRPHVPAQQRLP